VANSAIFVLYKQHDILIVIFIAVRKAIIDLDDNVCHFLDTVVEMGWPLTQYIWCIVYRRPVLLVKIERLFDLLAFLMDYVGIVNLILLLGTLLSAIAGTKLLRDNMFLINV